jgi:hypothetical protein
MKIKYPNGILFKDYHYSRLFENEELTASISYLEMLAVKKC